MSFFAFSLRRWLKSLFRSRRPHRRHNRARHAIELLEDRTTPATAIWSGAGLNNLWSNPANWQGNAIPAIDGTVDLVFPAGAARQLNQNDFLSAQFKSISFSAGGYNLQGNALTLGTAVDGTGNIIAQGASGSTNTIQFNIVLGGGASQRQYITVLSGTNLNIAGTLTGSAELFKDQNGTLILSADNTTFTGPITVGQGPVSVQHPLALGAVTQGTTVQSGGQLLIQNVGTINEPLKTNGTGVGANGAIVNIVGDNTLAGSVVMDSATTIGVNTSTSLTISGKISDTGAGHTITKRAAGHLIFTRDNSYRGQTLVTAGMLTIQDPSSLGTAGAGGDTIVSTGATLQLQNVDPNRDGFKVASEMVTLNGGGVLNGGFSGIGTLNNLTGKNEWAGVVNLGSGGGIGADVSIGVTFDTDPLLISGLVQNPNGPFTLTKILPGVLILDRANTYDTTTTILEGKIIARDSNALGAVTAGTTVFSGATLQLQLDQKPDSVTSNTTHMIFSEPLSIDGVGVGGVGALYSETGINSWTAEVVLAGFSGAENAIGVKNDDTTSADDDYFINDDSLTITGLIRDLFSGFTVGPTLSKVGLGHLILPNANNYTGLTDIKTGWITIQDNRSLGGLVSGFGDTAQPRTFVRNGAAVHLKAKTGEFLDLIENFTIAGLGIAHPNPKLNFKGAIENISGENFIGNANNIGGNIALQYSLGAADIGVGVEVLDAQPSHLTTFGTITGAPPTSIVINGSASGGQAEFRQLVDTGATSGTITVDYDFVAVPDTLHVYHDGALIYDSGLVSGAATVVIPYGPGTSTQVEIVINEGSGDPGTAWFFTANVVPNIVVTDFSLVKLGSKRLEMNSDGTYDGNLVVREGVIHARNETAFGNNGGRVVVEDGAALELDTFHPQQAGGLFGAGLQVGRDEHLILNGAGNTTADGTLIRPLTILQGDHLWRGPVTLLGDSILDIPAASRLHLAGNIDGTASGIVKIGPGTLALSGINSFSGVVQVQEGVLNVQSSQALGAADGTLATGTVVSDGAALQLQGNIVIAGEAVELHGSGAASSPIAPRWFQQGPHPVVDAETTASPQTKGDVAGSVTGVQVDQSDPDVIYVTTNDGGAWRTKDGGKSWQPMFDNAFDQLNAINLDVAQQILFGGSIAVSTNNPKIVYLATGNGFNDANSFYGRGVYKSTDSGKSWTLLLDAANVGFENPMDRVAINKVIIDPSNNDQIYVAVNSTTVNGTTPAGGVWRWDGSQWFCLTAPTPGLNNNPTSATRQDPSVWGADPISTNPGPNEDTAMSFPANGNYSDIAYSSGSLFIALGDIGGTAVNTVYRSPDASFSNTPNWFLSDGTAAYDQGGGTAAIPNGFNTNNFRNGMIRLAGGNIFTYASVVNEQTGGIDSIYRYDPFSQSWTTLTTPTNYLGTQGNTYNTFVVQPGNDSVLYLGGQSILRSSDGGLSWTDITTLFGVGPKTGAYSMTFDSQGRLLVGTDGGLWRHDSVANSWTNLNGNLAISSITGLDVDPDNPNRIVSGARSNGTVLLENGVWKQVRAGQAGAAMFDPGNANTLYRVGTGGFERSDDGGLTWAVKLAATAGSPFTISSVDSNRIVIDSGFIFESLDRGETWTSLSGVGAPAGVVALAPGAFTKNGGAYDPAIVWAMSSTSVGRTTNRGLTWSTASGGLPSSGLTDIIVDPRDADTAFVVRRVFAPLGQPGDQVWRTIDAGATWVNIAGDLPNVPVSKIIIDPRSGDLYIGTDVGVYRMKGEDLAADSYVWTPFGVGMPLTQVTDLVLNINTNTLTAGTNGRSAFTLWLDPSISPSLLSASMLAVSGNPVWTGPVILGTDTTIGAQGTQDLQNDSLNSRLTIIGQVDDGAGEFDLVKVGQGDVVLAGANTYDGDTFVNEGVLIVRNPSALGSTTGHTYVVDGAALEMQDSIAGETLHLKGTGFFQGGHPSGALRNTSNFNTYSGPIILETVNPLLKLDVAIGVDSGSQLTITGPISDGTESLNLIKELTGTLILASANIYDGTTRVVQGALRVAHSDALGNPAGQGTVVVDGAQLQLANDVTVVSEALSLSGSGINQTGALQNFSGDNVWQGAITLTSTPNTFPTTVPPALVAIGVVDADDELTITGNIIQQTANGVTSFGLRKVLPGTLTLSGTNLYSAVTNVEEGYLKIRSAGALGTTASGTTVSAGAALQMENDIVVTGEALTIAGSGPMGGGALQNLSGYNAWDGAIALAATAAIGADGDIVDSSLFITNGALNAITGAPGSNLHKVGTSRVAFVNPNGYAGHTFVDAGNLDIWDGGALGSTVSGTTVASGATLGLFFGIDVVGESLNLAGPGAAGLSGALEGSNAANTWNGPITLTADASVGVFSGGTLSLPNVIGDGGNTFGLTKNNAGTLILTGTSGNTYTGATTVNDGVLRLDKTGVAPFLGNLVVGDGMGAANSAVVLALQANQIPDAVSVSVQSDGHLNLNNFAETLGSLLVVGGHVSTGLTGNLTLNALTMTGGLIDLGSTGQNLTFALSANATFSSGGAGNSGAATIQSTGGSLGFTGAVRAFTVNPGVDVPSLIVNAPIVSAATFTKAGAGAMVVQSVNPLFTGIARIDAGTLQVDGVLGVPGVSGAVSLNGGTLGGSGTVNGVSAATFGTVSPGGVAAPVIGTLHTGATQLNAASFLHFNIASTVSHDVLEVDGSIDLNGATVTGVVDPAIPLGVPITIIRAINGGSVINQFAQGASAFIGGQKFSITYTATEVILIKVKNSATVVVGSTSNPTVYGQPVVVTIEVVPELGAGTIQDGTLIKLNSTGAGPSFPEVVLTLTGGKATATFPTTTPFALPTLNVGSHSFVATLDDTLNFNAAVSNSFDQTVLKANATLTISTVPAVPTYGAATTVVANLVPFAPGVGTITGSVVFTVDGVPQSAVPVDVNGNASITLPATFAVGAHTVVAAYSGDTHFNAVDNTLTPYTLTVNRNGSAVAVSASPTSILLNQSVTFTAAVTPFPAGAGIPTGTATFYTTLNGVTTLLGTGTLDAFGVATFSTSTLAAGNHQISVAYSGDINFEPVVLPVATASNPISFDVFAGLTSLGLATSGTPSAFGSPVTFTASVGSVFPSPFSPTGTATFFVDDVQQGAPVAVNGAGQATFTISTLTATNHTIRVEYSGDANFEAATNTIGQSVLQGATTTSVSSSVTPNSTYGQNVVFTASVVPVLPATILPTGDVTFSIDGVPQLPAVALNGSGVATFSVANLTPGAHTISVAYNGDLNYVSGSVGNVAQTVVKSPVSVAVSSSTSLPVYGQDVVLTAVVTPSFPGGLVPGQTATFFVDGVQKGAPVTLDGAGMASITVNDLPVGTPNITVVYSGDANYLTQTSPAFAQTVLKANTTSSLSSNNPVVIYGNDIIAAQVVSTVVGGPLPTGMVNFTYTAASGSFVLSAPLIAGVATSPHPDVGVYTSVVAQYLGDASYNPSTSNALASQTVNTASSDMTLSPSVSPSGFGGSVTFTATLTSADSPLAPSGTVVFSVNGAPTHVAAVVNGVATFTTSSLPVGAHTITAAFTNAQNNFAPVAKSIPAYVVNPGVTVIDLTVPATARFGETVVITAKVVPVAPAGGIPTGTVVFTIDGVPQAPITLDATGTATFTTSSLAVGSHSVVADYSGSTNYNASSANSNPTIVTGNTTTTLSSSSNPAIYSRPVTISATVAAVSPAVGVPQGSVVFTIDGVAQPAVPTVGGIATIVLDSSLSVAGSPHSISAAFTSANINFSDSSGTLAGGQSFVSAATTTALTSNSNPSTFFAPATFTATVSANAPATLTPDGSVVFFNGGTPISASIPLVNGSASFTINSLALFPPSHAITAVYTPANTNFLTSASNTVVQVVNKGITATVVTSSQNPATVSEPVITATVNVPTGAPTATGSITFVVTGATTATATVSLDGSGQAILPVLLNTGSNTIVATYAGDTQFNGSTSASFLQSVNQAGTTTSLVSSAPGGSVFGQSVTFTATVAPVAPATATPTGNIEFTVNGVVHTVPVDGSGQAALTLSNLPVSGANSIQARYTGSANYAFSDSNTVVQSVSAVNTTVSVVSSANPIYYTQSATFTATVDAVSPSLATPSGMVIFTVDGVAQPAVNLDPNGQATITVRFNTPGDHVVVATYVATTNFNASVSSNFIETVNPQPIAFASVPAKVNAAGKMPIRVNFYLPNTTTIDTTFNGQVTLRLQSGPSGGTFSTMVVNAVNGVATFNAIAPKKFGNYRFSAQVLGLPVISSRVVTVTAKSLAGTINAKTGVISLTARDGLGAIATNFSGPVKIALVSAPSGARVTGKLTGTMSRGVATIKGLGFSKAGVYTLRITVNNLSFNLKFSFRGRLT